AYSLGKAQRVIALIREAGYQAPIYLHGAMEKITHYYQGHGIALGELKPVRGTRKADLAGTITLAPPSATSDLWTRRFPDPLTATIAATGAGEIWVTHGQEDALVHWCQTRGLAARPLHLVGYDEEEEN